MHSCVFTIQAESPEQDDIRAAFAEADREYAALYPAESNHLVDTAQLRATGSVLLAVRNTAILCGYGACVPCITDENAPYAELKRMYVLPAWRRRGIAAQILHALEELARERELFTIRLETGIYQPAAIALYERSGYRPIRAFGQYQPDPLSVYYEKILSCAE